MVNKLIRQVESGRNKLIVSSLILFLLGMLLLQSWSKESEYNQVSNRESSQFSSVLGGAVVYRMVFACVVLGCGLLAYKKPKVAFGLAAAIGAADIFWSFTEVVTIPNAFAAVKAADLLS